MAVGPKPGEIDPFALRLDLRLQPDLTAATIFVMLLALVGDAATDQVREHVERAVAQLEEASSKPEQAIEDEFIESCTEEAVAEMDGTEE